MRGSDVWCAPIYNLSMRISKGSEQLAKQAQSFATFERVSDVVKQTTLNLNPSYNSIAALCFAIQKRFVRLVLKGEPISEDTIRHAIPNRNTILPISGRKRRGKPGLGEKAAQSRE